MRKNLHKRKINLNGKLAAYSAMAGAFVAASASEAEAAIEYTNINDTTITNGYYDFDFNMDGTVDLFILDTASTGYGAVFMGAYPGYAEFVGYTGTYGGNVYQYASALNANDMIDANNNFYSNFGTMNYQGQYGQWIGVTDKFLGFKVYINGNQHFGWIRLDVPADASSFTVKDYAYNDVANSGIAAGDKGSIGIDEKSLAIQAISYDNNIRISSDEVINGDITVFNTAGQVIYQENMNGNELTISLDVPKGVYILRVRKEEAIYTKELYLD